MNTKHPAYVSPAGANAAEHWLRGAGPAPDAAEIEAVWRGIGEATGREFRTLRAGAAEASPHFTAGERWHLLDTRNVSSVVNGHYEHGNWTAGFAVGVLWLNALAGGAEQDLAQLARTRLAGLAHRAEDHMTHDIGFLFYPSYVFGALLGHLDAGELAPALRAARQLALRFNERTQLIQAFGPIGHPVFGETSTIDTMMNLPLLFWAGRHGGEPALTDAARRHARTSARLYFRPDGSTYHLLNLDPVSGALIKRGTFQGATDASCWSRGQAWAACGFAWAYGQTGEWELLEASERALAYFFAQLPADAIAPWDFTDTANTPDASASAAVALGCLFLASFHPEPAAAGAYRRAAHRIIASLGGTCLNTSAERDGILHHSCYSKPHNLGVDAATAWGDFYFSLATAIAAGKLDAAALVGKNDGR